MVGPKDNDGPSWDIQKMAMVLVLGTSIGGVGTWVIPDRVASDLKEELRRTRVELRDLEHEMNTLENTITTHQAVSQYWVDRIKELERVHTTSGISGHLRTGAKPKYRFPQE